MFKKKFSPFFSPFWKNSLLFPVLFFVSLFFYAFDACMRACSRASSDIYYRTASTAQRSQPAQAAKQVRADQTATTQADRAGSSEHVVEHLYHSLCYPNKQINRNLAVRSNLTGVMREGFASED